MKHYIITDPIRPEILNAGKTRTVFDFSRVPEIPKHIRQQAVSLVTNSAIAEYLGIKVHEGPIESPKEACIYWLVTCKGEPRESKVTYYRISVYVFDALQYVQTDDSLFRAIVKLCDDRKLDAEAEGLTTNAVEFRCKELGIYTERKGNELVLNDVITNNEARVLAYAHGLLIEYDKSYEDNLLTEVPNPVTAALAEWDLW